MEKDDLKLELIDTGNKTCEKFGFELKSAPLGAWPSDDQKFILAEEVIEIGEQLIDRFRKDLAPYQIGYVFKQKAPKKDGEVVLGTAKTESELQKVLHGYDAIIQISYDTWEDASDDQKFRLVYHELEHLAVDSEKGKVFTIDHTVREFSSVIRIFGPGCSADVDFVASYKKFCEDNGSNF